MQVFEQFARRGSLLKLTVAIGLLQTALYYLIGATVRPDGGFAIPHYDTLLYCQAARRIVEGFPFSFSPGTAASTGTTGVLYPFLLSVPYALGCTGDALFRAGFVLNALFYLVFLCGWGLVIDAKMRGCFTRLVAAVLVASFGQVAYTVFSQNDMGLWLAVSSLFAAGLALKKPSLYGAILVLAPWVRPEGLVCIFAFGLALVAACVIRRWLSMKDAAMFEVQFVDWLVLALALISVAGVGLLNYRLTGSAGFSSIALKGHFKTLPFLLAVYATAGDLVMLLKSLVLGIPAESPRDLYFVPVIGAVLVWTAVICRDWRRNFDWREGVWILVFGGGLLSVAQSGWQNTNVDRYLAWLLPTVLVFIAGGVGVCRERFGKGGVGLAAGVLVMAFGCAISPVKVALYGMVSRDADHLREFAVACIDKVEPGASFGCWGDCGFVYVMPPHKVCHLSGIYSMEYLTKSFPTGTWEILKNEPERRFDYWFHNSLTSGDNGARLGGVIADQILVGPSGYELLKARWERFEAAAAAPSAPTDGASLKARVDVGYERDEKSSNYTVVPLYNESSSSPFLVFEKRGDAELVDVGRVIVGGDEMTVDLEPGKDVHVVMRMLPEREVVLTHGRTSRPYRFAFANPLGIAVTVNGESAGTVSIGYAKEGFSDVSFVIPGSAIANSSCRIAFLGDHITCGYWFYQ